MAKMKENSRKVFEYLKGINGEDVTAADVAEEKCRRHFYFSNSEKGSWRKN